MVHVGAVVLSVLATSAMLAVVTGMNRGVAVVFSVLAGSAKLAVVAGMVHVGAMFFTVLASSAIFAVVAGMGSFCLPVLLAIVMLIVLAMHRRILLRHFKTLL